MSLANYFDGVEGIGVLGTANPHAAYLFLEHGERRNGLRMYLTKVRDETDPEKIEALRREGTRHEEDGPAEEGFLVHFQVDQVRRLVDFPLAEAR